MSFDDAYEALTDHDDDARWAYGTGFSDPMVGVSTEVPEGVGAGDLMAYCLMLGDDALIMSHRLQEWVTRAPELEDELAIANIGLDLLGQARLLLTRAGEVEGAGRGEDALAYLREPAEFRNVRLVESVDRDFAQLVARLLIFASWRLALLNRLTSSRDPVLAAIAAKGVKEVTYHREYAAQWVVRLGDGTKLSHERMQAAIDAVWPMLGELFQPHEIESRLAAAGVAVAPADLHDEFVTVLDQVLSTATLTRPDDSGPSTPREPGDGGATAARSADDPRAASGPGQSVSRDDPAPGQRSTAGAVRDLDGGLNVGAVRDVEGGLNVGAVRDVEGGLNAGRGARAAGGAAVIAAGRDGRHGPEMAGILAEIQGLARSLPGSSW